MNIDYLKNKKISPIEMASSLKQAKTNLEYQTQKKQEFGFENLLNQEEENCQRDMEEYKTIKKIYNRDEQ